MRPAILLCALVFTGCASFLNLHPQPTMTGDPYAAVYRINADCADPEYVRPPDDGYSHDVVAVSPSEYARWVMCGVAEPKTPPLDADPDPVFAAGHVALCVGAYECGLTTSNPDYPPTPDLPKIAAMWDLAMRIDEEQVTAELAKGTLPPYMQAAFVARYTAARAQIRAVVAAQGPHWRELYLKPALAARAARSAADEVLAPWKDKIDAAVHAADAAVVAGKPSAETVERVLAARRTYVTACRKVRKDLASCLTDPFGHALDQAITRVAQARGDASLVEVEGVLANDVAAHEDPRNDEYLAEVAAFDAERARFAAYKKLLDTGVSSDLLAQKWPTVPLDLGDQQPAIGLASRPTSDHFYARGDNATTTTVEDAVRGIEHHGAMATVLFKKNVSSGMAPACHTTNRVDRVEEDGQVTYQEDCNGPMESYYDDSTTKSAQVPWVEVAHVKAGEIAHLVVDIKTRKGHVGWIGAPRTKKGDQYTTDTPAVQVLEWRL